MSQIFKICSKCNQLKSLDNFYIRSGVGDGHRPECKECQRSLKQKQYQLNRSGIIQRSKKYYQDNKKEILKKQRQYRSTHVCEIKQYYQDNKERISQRQKQLRELNKSKENSRLRDKQRLAADPNYKLRKYLRSRLNIAIKKGCKSGSAVKDLGCTIPELKQYLESKFQFGMSWDNWGNKPGTWQIDHIVPLSSFDLTNREEFLNATHYTNLQPLWYEDHLKKSTEEKGDYDVRK